MADFLYNAEVTADDLNNIAVDLGAGTFSVFADSVPYAVDQLNQITGNLVSAGVTSSLNKLMVTADSSGITVSTGIGIFSDGRKIKISTPLVLPFTVGEVFIENDKALNKISVKVGVLPTESEYIHLATVSASATVTDRRTMAKAKVLLPSEGQSYCADLSCTVTGNVAVTKTIDISGISKVFIEFYETDNKEEAGCSGYLDCGTMLFNGIRTYDGALESVTEVKVRRKNNASTYWYTISFVKEDEKLSLSIVHDETGLNNGKAMDHDVHLMVYAYGGI